MTSWKHCSLSNLKQQAQIPNKEKRVKLNKLFYKHRELFYENTTKEEWKRNGFKRYSTNPDKIIITHKDFPDIIMKLINPKYLNEENSESLIRLNLSRVFVAREIQKYSIKWVTTPVKHILYVESLNQWIVVAQKLKEEDMNNTKDKLKALDQEHLDELFYVCEKVGFYDLAPRNVAIVKSFIGDKIYIIDTENITEVTDETEQERLAEMKFLFKIFSENLNPSLSPRYTKRYDQPDLNSPSNLITSKSLIRQWEKFAIMNKSINKKDLKKEEKHKLLSPKKLTNLTFRRSEQPSPKGYKKISNFELNSLITTTRRVSDVEVRKFNSLKDIEPGESLTPRIPGSPSTPQSSPSSDSSTESTTLSRDSISKSSPNLFKKSNSFRDLSESIILQQQGTDNGIEENL